MVKAQLRYSIVSVGVAATLLLAQASCTKSKEDKPSAAVEEKGRVEQITDHAADTAVKKIRTPIDKARTTRDLGDERLESMDKVLQQQ